MRDSCIIDTCPCATRVNGFRKPSQHFLELQANNSPICKQEIRLGHKTCQFFVVVEMAPWLQQLLAQKGGTQSVLEPSSNQSHIQHHPTHAYSASVLQPSEPSQLIKVPVQFVQQQPQFDSTGAGKRRYIKINSRSFASHNSVQSQSPKNESTKQDINIGDLPNIHHNLYHKILYKNQCHKKVRISRHKRSLSHTVQTSINNPPTSDNTKFIIPNQKQPGKNLDIRKSITILEQRKMNVPSGQPIVNNIIKAQKKIQKQQQSALAHHLNPNTKSMQDVAQLLLTDQMQQKLANIRQNKHQHSQPLLHRSFQTQPAHLQNVNIAPLPPPPKNEQFETIATQAVLHSVPLPPPPEIQSARKFRIQKPAVVAQSQDFRAQVTISAWKQQRSSVQVDIYNEEGLISNVNPFQNLQGESNTQDFYEPPIEATAPSFQDQIKSIKSVQQIVPTSVTNQNSQRGEPKQVVIPPKKRIMMLNVAQTSQNSFRGIPNAPKPPQYIQKQQ